jgi:predicted dehydrogenase
LAHRIPADEGSRRRSDRERTAGAFTIIQVGAGLWGRSWAELIARAPGFRLAALVDASADARHWASETLGAPVFRTLSKALRAVESHAVLLVSPPDTHRPLVEASLAAGRHVVVEKPLALTLEDAAAIASAGRVSRLHVMVAQNYRFRRQSRALGEIVGRRALGRLKAVHVQCRRDLRSMAISPRDWRARMPHPYLLDMAVHHVDLLRAITGHEVVEVDARSWQVPDAPFRHDTTVEALITLADGTPVAYAGSWAAPDRLTSWNGDWEFIGTSGRATWNGGVGDALRGTVEISDYQARPARAALPVLQAVDRLAVLHELRRAVATGDQPECSAVDNINTLRATLALARSTETRRPVSVAELGAA